MEHHSQERPRTSPKDFFLHLLNIIMLYISAYSFGQAVFFMINYYVKDAVTDLGYYYSFPGFEGIRWSISALIVAYPAYLVGARSLRRDYLSHPEKKNLRVKQWLEYLTVFGTALIILITCMTVIYKFLGGEVTLRFLLKALTIVYIAGSMFAYYLVVVKQGLEARKQQIKALVAVVSVSVIVAIIAAFATVGSPKTQRLRAADQSRLDRMQTLVYSIGSYYQVKRALPEGIPELNRYQGYPADVTSPDTQEPIEYIKDGTLAYRLCATFALSSADRAGSAASRPQYSRADLYGREYDKGKQCFELTIEPSDYPPIKQ